MQQQIEIGNDQEQEDTQALSFLDHVEALRWHIIRSFIAVCVCFTGAFVKMDFIFSNILLAPAKPGFWTYRMLCKISPATCVEKINFSLQSRQVTGQFTMHFLAAFTIGFIVAFPYIFWEFWSFIKPGLYQNEKKQISGTVFSVTVLFVLGIFFGYYIMAPLSINFLANYTLDPMIVNQFDITSYIGTLCMIVISGGLMFQLPIAVFILSKFGIITPGYMRKYRKHAVVILFAVAAVVTPSPDMISQMMVGVPLYLLYEISIFVSFFVNRKRKHI